MDDEVRLKYSVLSRGITCCDNKLASHWKPWAILEAEQEAKDQALLEIDPQQELVEFESNLKLKALAVTSTMETMRKVF